MKRKIKVNSIVKFNTELSIYNMDTKKTVLYRKAYPTEYMKYYKSLEDRLFIYLGDIVQQPGHCILVDMNTGLLEVGHHTDNFVVVPEDEC